MCDTICRCKPHPWHGISIGLSQPDTVNCFVECTQNEGLKYEIDKETGYLKVDRPHKYSSMMPCAYGFIPQTYCAERTANVCMQRTTLTDVAGDGDPLDCCVLSTRLITHGNVIVSARPIGGLRMIDNGEVDDKIIAVIEGDDLSMSAWTDISDVPQEMLDALRHYFLTYKQGPDDVKQHVRIVETYGRDAAHEVISATRQDYIAHYEDCVAKELLQRRQSLDDQNKDTASSAPTNKRARVEAD